MLPRSNFTIKKLVHQRPESPYEYRPTTQHDDMAHMDNFRQRSQSQPGWTRNWSKRLPAEPVMFSNPQNVHDVSKPVPPLPLPQDMPRSSSLGALSGVERPLEYPSRRNRNASLRMNKGSLDAGSARRPLTPELGRLSETTNLDLPPPPPPKPGTPTASTPTTPMKRVETAPPETSSRSDGSFDSSRSFLDLEDWPEPPSTTQNQEQEQENGKENDEGVERKGQDETDENKNPGTLSDDIEQLIRETDKAWDDIGNTFNELAESASTRSSIDEPPAVPPKEDYRPRTPPASVPSTPATPPRSPTAHGQHANNPTPPLKSPTRDTPAPKAKAKAPAPRKHSKSHRAVEPLKRMPRWKLDENVKDVLTGQIFKKIEADEMLTPERLREIRAIREQEELRELRERKSSESDRLPVPMPETDESETPIDSFHLQDLPTRIGAAGVNMLSQQQQQQQNEAAARSDADQAVRRDFSVPRKAIKLGTPTPAKAKTEEQECPDITISAPSQAPTLNLPPRNSSKAAQQGAQHQALETIPEVQSIASPLKTSACEFTQQLFSPNDDDDFVFYYSSPFTLNMPNFRHGPIRFPKSEIARCMNLAPDETLDWTAFQMAILGGAGDFFSGPSDFGANLAGGGSRHTETDEHDELASWFDTFGFEHSGELVTEEMAEADATLDATEKGRAGSDNRLLSFPTSSPEKEGSRSSQGDASRSSAEYSPAVTDPDTLPIPIANENPAGFWNEGHVDGNKFLVEEGHGRTKQRKGRDSVSSLPQSPMMDLVFVRSQSATRETGAERMGGGEGGDENDVEGDFVPMGYNLGHDLGDFLRWEAQHMYALGQE